VFLTKRYASRGVRIILARHLIVNSC